MLYIFQHFIIVKKIDNKQIFFCLLGLRNDFYSEVTKLLPHNIHCFLKTVVNRQTYNL